MSHATDNPVNLALGFPLAAEFERDLTQLLSNDTEVVLAVLDLDHFMRVNTQFGHEKGDEVLIHFGRYLREKLPQDVKLYRFGGDEFAVVFGNGQEREEVFLLMEEIRKDYSCSLPDGSPMLITAGIASSVSDGDRYHELVRMAEGALHRGKASGKNRVTLAREEKMVTRTTHYTTEQLKRLTKVAKRDGVGEAILLREALDMLLSKYDA